MRVKSACVLHIFVTLGCSAEPVRAPTPANEAPAPREGLADGSTVDAAEEPTVDGSAAVDVYDLEADRQARMRAASLDLGAHAHAVMVTPPFVLAGATRAATQGAAPFIEAVLGAYRNQRFDTAPTRAISIYVFPSAAQYHAYCRRQYGGDECMSRFGFYLPDERKIIMQGGPGGTLSHELAHPFYEADFPEGPTWLNEGIAALFEQPILHPKGEIHGGKNWRLPRLVQAMRASKERDYARLPTLFGMSDDTFRGDRESLHYAMARYTCQWLDEHGWLWPFYRAYRDGIATDPTGALAFAKVVGQSPADADVTWRRWVLTL